MGHRRKARELALQGLYMHELRDSTPEELVPLGWITEQIPDDIRRFCESLITTTIEHREEIDALIIRFSKNWKFERIPPVDKSILRIAIAELLFFPDIPEAVTINEAIELGKEYGGEHSGQFINGILDAVHHKPGRVPGA